MSGVTNLARNLTDTTRTQAGRVAVRVDDAAMTYRALDEASARVAGLLHERGLKPGDRVGIMMPNVAEVPVVYYGVLRAGGVVVPMNPLLKAREIVAAYTREQEHWLRNRSAARAARIRDLLSGERVNVSATEATLGYRLRQYHVGLVCWAGDATAAVDNITRLEHAISHVAGKAACSGDPAFLPRDESSAWAWLLLGIRDTFDAVAGKAACSGDPAFLPRDESSAWAWLPL